MLISEELSEPFTYIKPNDTLRYLYKLSPVETKEREAKVLSSLHYFMTLSSGCKYCWPHEYTLENLFWRGWPAEHRAHSTQSKLLESNRGLLH